MLEQIGNFFISFEALRKLYAYLFHPKYLIGVNIVAFNESKKVLLARHSWDEKYRWRVPGGLVGKKEELRLALIREVKEELDLDISKNHLSFIAAKKTKGFPRVDIYFLYNSYITGNLRPGIEIKKLKFFKTLSLPKSLFPGQTEVIKEAVRLLSAKN